MDMAVSSPCPPLFEEYHASIVVFDSGGCAADGESDAAKVACYGPGGLAVTRDENFVITLRKLGGNGLPIFTFKSFNFCDLTDKSVLTMETTTTSSKPSSPL